MNTVDGEAGAQRLLPAVLVAKRSMVLKLDRLEMRCDAQEIPDPLKPAASYLNKEKLTLKDVVGAKSNQTRWIAIGSFSGVVLAAGPDSEPSTKSVAGPVAMTIVEGESRLLGILAPDDKSAPSLWWAWPLADLTVGTEGEQGTFRKRPRKLTIRTPDSTLELIEVAYLRNDKSSFTQKRETDLVKALRAR